MCARDAGILRRQANTEHGKEGMCKNQTLAEPQYKDPLEPKNSSSKLSPGAAHSGSALSSEPKPRFFFCPGLIWLRFELIPAF